MEKLLVNLSNFFLHQKITFEKKLSFKERTPFFTMFPFFMTQRQNTNDVERVTYM